MRSVRFGVPIFAAASLICPAAQAAPPAADAAPSAPSAPADLPQLRIPDTPAGAALRAFLDMVARVNDPVPVDAFAPSFVERMTPEGIRAVIQRVRSDEAGFSLRVIDERPSGQLVVLATGSRTGKPFRIALFADAEGRIEGALPIAAPEFEPAPLVRIADLAERAVALIPPDAQTRTAGAAPAKTSADVLGLGVYRVRFLVPHAPPELRPVVLLAHDQPITVGSAVGLSHLVAASALLRSGAIDWRESAPVPPGFVAIGPGPTHRLREGQTAPLDALVHAIVFEGDPAAADLIALTLDQGAVWGPLNAVRNPDAPPQSHPSMGLFASLLYGDRPDLAEEFDQANDDGRTKIIQQVSDPSSAPGTDLKLAPESIAARAAGRALPGVGHRAAPVELATLMARLLADATGADGADPAPGLAQRIDTRSILGLDPADWSFATRIRSWQPGVHSQTWGLRRAGPSPDVFIISLTYNSPRAIPDDAAIYGLLKRAIDALPASQASAPTPPPAPPAPGPRR
jgi:hypothetical protein